MYINLKESTTEKLLELVSDYRKIVGYEVNIKKSMAFLYTSNEQLKFEIKNIIQFTLAPFERNRYKSNKFCIRSINICTRAQWGKLQK